MSTELSSIERIIDSVYNAPPPKPEDFIISTFNTDSFSSKTRPKSRCTEDTLFGDSGKGRAVQEINDALIKLSTSGILYSYKYNGTRNVGREIVVRDIKLSLHQLPVACTQEGAVAILGKGMLIHPNDLATEMKYVESRLGAEIPGKILIDSNATVITDVHAAYEKFTNKKLNVGNGATGSGVAQGYSTWYEKRAVTIKDFVSDNWKEIFTKQYNFYADLMGGADVLAATEVNRLGADGKRVHQLVGSLNEHLDQLEDVRKVIIEHALDTRYTVENVWREQFDIPFSFEGSNGPGLDPYYGLYPDITASRPVARIGIPDSTEGVVNYEEIELTFGVMKNPYMSSVGCRVPPYLMAEDIASMYRKENDETGRSSGRDRGIYPIDLVAMKALGRISGYKYLAVTHLDSNHPDIPIEVVTHYVNKKTGKIEPYRPYQWHWDQVDGLVSRLPSWDGKEVAKVETVNDLPVECLQYLKFISKVVTPVAMITFGRELGKSLYFIR